MTLSKGVVYVATGLGYTQMAMRSAKSVKKLHPELAIHLFTDQQNLSSDCVDSVSIIQDPQRRSKISYLNETPFNYTLFLDADTLLISPLRDLFEWLNKYDLAMVHAIQRNTFATNQNWRGQIPKAYPQFNTGVILYKNTTTVRSFFSSWKQAYGSTSMRLDQVSFRRLCWDSKLNIGVLPPYYNIRDKKFIQYWESKNDPVIVLHLDAYKERFEIEQELKRQRSLSGRLRYILGSIKWIINKPLSWKAKLIRHQ